MNVGDVSGYGSWHQMHERCSRKTHSSYKHYGALGIKVCKRWDSFKSFLKDMGVKPEGMTLDRIDSSKNYSPKNCRWANRHDQARNKKNNVWLEYKGKRMILTDWAKAYGMPKLKLWKRINSGYSVKDALEMGYRERDCKMIEFQGERLSITGWAKRTGISITSMSRRIINGWPLHIALNSKVQRGRRVTKGGAYNALD